MAVSPNDPLITIDILLLIGGSLDLGCVVLSNRYKVLRKNIKNTNPKTAKENH